MTATSLVCVSCGAKSGPAAKFCAECGARLTPASQAAEYKQVTVLFADVVHSMEIAAAVGAERLREIMAELANRCAAVVQRFGGTVDKFTGDGIMAVFGAPVALEDHAIRACLAALAIQEEADQLAVHVHDRDGVQLSLRVGLNSGQVIAGEIGSGSFGYTTIGEQVGMAQRMESAASPGGVMLSASTAGLVAETAVLGDPQSVRIKGADDPVPARRLLGMAEPHRAVRRTEPHLVGRRSEMSAVERLDRAVAGHGAVVGVVGSPGVGKSRLVRDISATAAARRIGVFTAFCESHASNIPFLVVARLLRAATLVDDLRGEAARSRIRAQLPDADPEDLLLLDDLLGIADPGAALPVIDPDARRRRLTSLINNTALARAAPVVYVVEDVHWIDNVSESMLADFFTVIPRTSALVLVTYRPEYQGPLPGVVGEQSIALAPLSDSEIAALVSEMVGADASVGEVGSAVTDRAAGNPFFAGEMVRELAERGVLVGRPGAYVSTAEITDVGVPATLQATIAARIDRLGAEAKRTLNAAAVIGSRFTAELLTALGIDPRFDDLVTAELIDQPVQEGAPEYVFHHPLIRTVAYESQLKSARCEMHRRLAVAIESRDPTRADENAALIAEHFEAAGDLRAAFDWHMRAGSWSTNRDIAAARLNWQRARQVADQLHADDPERAPMRIAPRTLLCATAWRVGGSVEDAGFDELRALATAAGDKRSHAVGMSGLLLTLAFHGQFRRSARLASEYAELLDAIDDPELTVGLLFGAVVAKWEAGEATTSLQLVQREIDSAHGDPAMGDLIVGSPLALALAMRGSVKSCLGRPGWKDDLDEAVAMARDYDPFSRALTIMFRALPIGYGALLPDSAALRDTAEALDVAERSGDDFALANAQLARGALLVQQPGGDRGRGFDLLMTVRRAALQQRFTVSAVWFVDTMVAKEKGRTGDIDGAIELSRTVVDDLLDAGNMIWSGLASSTLVELLLQRSAQGDHDQARAAIDRLAAVPTEPGFVLHALPILRLRALLAQAISDRETYRDYRDRYRAAAASVGFEGHMKWAEEMP
ncbi:adenylate/guanylate cyclase domain-containing protein [Mycobacterium sp. NPDC050441]|uniref:adenylate/guanylate cyclase domain-containing protein n=1 Tax=Mycobacterium sp. NPDC050441 TaxID=3155403 RepID=UPI0033C0ADCB